MQNQPGNKTASSQFLKTDGGKTKSNTIEVPSVSLPKGGGALKGIDEKFSVNAVNGTAAFSIPLPFSSARGASPSLSLSYNSGAGNGIFGLGWSMGLSSIKRKTDKSLPQYLDDIDSDTFLFSEAEDLVPEFKKELDGSFSLDVHNDYIVNEKNSPDTLFIIRFYKPRIEGLFARIERWKNKNSGEIKWRVITKSNVTTLFGWSTASRITHPTDSSKIFEWLPEFSFDDKGNCTQYIYKKEDNKAFDSLRLHNRNRLVNGNVSYTNLYPEKVLYGNRTPYKNFADAFPAETDYLFSTVFDFGEYDQNAPYAKIKDWDFRTDAFSNYKAGFEIRTTRLCKRVLLFHHFTGVGEYNGLVKSLNMEYDTLSQQDFTFLKSVTVFGYIKKPGGTYSSKNLPAMEFDYQKHDWNSEVKSISTDDLAHVPGGLDGQRYQFTDLFNEGLAGILSEQANGWYYKHNQGNGKFERAKLVSPKPSFMGLGSQLQLADLDADGGKQLVSYGSEPRGYFELNGQNNWHLFQNFKQLPNIEFGDSNTRMLDLDGDGKTDLLISEENVFTWYPSDGRNGFSGAHKNVKPYDEEDGPHVVFADEKETIFLADMSGDGLTDLVLIRNGEVCYWPNLGYGKFGKKVAMDNAPWFDRPGAFNASYIRLSDIDGSGTADIIYLGKNKFSCYSNLSGNSLCILPFQIDTFPEIHSQSKITVADLLGNGVACITWTSTLSKDTNASIKYIDLMNSKKPHLMVSYKNNLGKEVSLEYSPSTKFYIEDKLSGKQWITKLHFPVHCISKSTINDSISGSRFISTYKYHHGYYDHTEREFRGFGMVEQTDAEHFEHWIKGNASNIVDKQLHQEPVISKSWFHTGAFLDREKILNQFTYDYWYEEMSRQGFQVVHHEAVLPDAKLVTAGGIDPGLIDHLSADEWQEALRACKNMTLRSEVFAHDAPGIAPTSGQLKKQLTPYTVRTQNCLIELLQPKGKNKHAIFVVKESESVSYNYERNVEDPRIAHNLNIKIDEYGNVLESAMVVYPRTIADVLLPSEIKQQQDKTVIIHTLNKFTNDLISDNVYRLRLPSEVKNFELKGVLKSQPFYKPADFEAILNDIKSTTAEYHELNKPLSPGKAQRRLLEHVRTIYYKNDLTGALALHHLQSLALSFENYQLAYTPGLLNDIFDVKANAALMLEGKFTHSKDEADAEDNNWWVRSGTAQFIDGAETNITAQNRFYVPVAYTDPYGAKTKVKYYGSYFLFIQEAEDALGNKSKAEKFNFRTLSPQRMKDINGNFSEAIADELGLVKAMAVFGKGNEADDLSGINEFTDAAEIDLVDVFFNTPDTPEGVLDSTILINAGKQLLQHATSRFVYDINAYKNSGTPAVIAGIVREQHFRKNNNSPVQLSFEYTNGFGKVIMKKVQAEPGIAKRVIVNANNSYTITEINTSALVPKTLRWIGNGRTILNNKGNPVKQYEPYFSATNKYENYKELVETGVTPVMYYDAVGRLVKTEMPNGTFSQTEFDSWKQNVYDANDTVATSIWYLKRTDNTRADFINDIKEQQAAAKALKHANTPLRRHMDTLGRPVLEVDHNKNLGTDADEFYLTKVLLDAEGNLRQIADARGNTVLQYKYDMLGKLVYQDSMDTGKRWLLVNTLGNPLRTWDERNNEFQYFYDILHRPAHSKVAGGDGAVVLDNIFNRIIYGESLLLPGRTNEAALQAINILGKPVKNFDTGGVIESPEYDFKGQPVSTTRKLFKNYKAVTNWTDANLSTALETGEFTFRTETDALGRITKQTTPDSGIITPSYDEAGLLNGETVDHVNPAITNIYIKDIDYNEKGQRNKIIYGNDVITRFYYDKETFRLNRLETKRANNDPLQDWNYTYDARGNITHVEDKNIPLVFFNNQKITGVSAYTYDALYRLAEAKGRENNAALNYNQSDNWNDAPYIHVNNPGDAMAVRNYTQNYQYDEVGNIKQVKHAATGNNWVRDYTYQNTNNRLINTIVGQGANTFTLLYPHHIKHGFITAMPHLEQMDWNFKEELIKSIQQKRNDGGTAETTYYQYDGQGQRIRKITENTADAGATPTKKEERIYVSGFETYRTYQVNAINFERESLSLMGEGHRFVLVEKVKQNANPASPPSESTGARLVRYQLHNHLGSAALELDGNPAANVISYEEYHPFGTTAYLARSGAITAAAKRYRYTGMERDEETGLEYHSARYYLPWLARWCNADPIGIKDGVNVFRYCNNNPVSGSDITGTQANPGLEDPKPVITPLVTQISPVSISGTAQVNNLFSSDRSLSGQANLSLGLRSSFILRVPTLDLTTTGIVDARASASVDTTAGTGQLNLSGSAVAGDLTGLHLRLIGNASLQVPVPGQIPINNAAQTFASALPAARGDLNLQGAFHSGTTSLAEFRARATVDSGTFTGRLDATTIGNIGRLRVNASGTFDSTGSLKTIAADANLQLPGVNLNVVGQGSANADGSFGYNASGNLRLLGLQSLRFQGTGIVSSAETNFQGTFSGPGPLYTSYIAGDFSLSTTQGISGSAGVVGLTYSPAVNATDAAPPLPPVAGAPRNPWEPGGLTLGASYFQYSQGNLNYVSAGFMPDLSANVLSNPRIGITAQWHFTGL